MNIKLCCAGPDWLITLQTKVNKEQREKRYPQVIIREKGSHLLIQKEYETEINNR